MIGPEFANKALTPMFDQTLSRGTSIMIRTLTVSLTSVLVLTGASLAQEAHNRVLNGQINLNRVDAINTVVVNTVDKALEASSIATGNNLSAKIQADHIDFQNNQRMDADVTSHLNIDAQWAKSVEATNAAFSNNARLEGVYAHQMDIHNTQTSGVAPRPVDPLAVTNINIDTSNAVNASTVAMANNFGVVGTAPTMNFTSHQTNRAITNAQSSINMDHVNRITSNASAIGNNVSIQNGWFDN